MITATADAAACQTLDRWYAAWNAHDVPAIAALVTDDIRYEDPTAAEPVMHGRAAVEAWATVMFAAMPDLHLERLDTWVTTGGAVIASAFGFTATPRGALVAPGLPPLAATNTPIKLLGMDRSELRDDRLARHQIYVDTADAGRQLGAFPPSGGPLDKISRRAQHLVAARMRRQAATS